ncbi:hypothetical protein PN498_08630 [Oscillatoria sp. CS-180]|uniref:hypothetical protein n=1 Tax=Oscillatoria sp. CS-180 TaxID=3021720 RepID=UPI0023314FC9|nr:hypothetical protein [Oscillatoria sp. CS-180]MDB9526049.1 hypothetical protein [Oscillatoria sp. CS-180]
MRFDRCLVTFLTFCFGSYWSANFAIVSELSLQVLTLVIMIVTCSPKRTLVGAPGALGKEDST